MFQKDYILRQIEMLSGAVQRVFKKENKQERFELVYKSEQELEDLKSRLNTLVKENKLSLAEDELFNHCEKNRTEKEFSVAVDFFASLNNLSDEQLTAADYSRDEISKGLTDVLKLLKQK